MHSAIKSFPLKPMLSFVTSPNPLIHRTHKVPTCQHSHPRPFVSARLISLPTGLDMEVIDVPHFPFLKEQPLIPASSPAITKPALLFIHGSLHAAWCFRLFQSFFANQGYQTFAVSLRRAGLTQSTDASSDPPSVNQHIQDLTALIQELNLPQPPIVIAHSMGGFIAQKWVESGFTPHKMVLLSSTPPSATAKMAFRMLFRIGLRKTYIITLGFIRQTCAEDVDVCRLMFFSPKDAPGFSEELEGDDKLREYMECLKLTGRTVDRKDLRSPVKENGNFTGQGNVLVIGGEQDCIVDEAGVEETAGFWGTKPYMIKDAPHDLMLSSQWTEVAEYISAWLQEKLKPQSN